MFWVKRHLYYQVSKGSITVTYVEKETSITEPCDALNHPRTLMGNFHDIADSFKQISQRLAPQKFFYQNHIAILHLLENVEGGYTNVEIRAFLEAALVAGAREILLPKETYLLSREQILNRNFAEHEKP